MLRKCHWIVLYTVHFTAFCLGGPFLSGHGVVKLLVIRQDSVSLELNTQLVQDINNWTRPNIIHYQYFNYLAES